MALKTRQLLSPVLKWAAVIFLCIAVITAMHNLRQNQIDACDRSHQKRDKPVAAFARAAYEARWAAYKADGKEVDRKSAATYLVAAKSLETLARSDCKKNYPPGLFGI